MPRPNAQTTAVAANRQKSTPQTPVVGPSHMGCFRELTPAEFDPRKEMLVVVVHHPHALAEFKGFAGVVAVENCQELESYLKSLDAVPPLGLVCADGETSARMAIRLSQQGRTVSHLAGGLAEWRGYSQQAH